MDTGKGYMERFETEELLKEKIDELVSLKEKVGSIFKVGEIIEIKDSKFRIRSLGKREMRLRLVQPR